MENGIVMKTKEGSPKGGNLSPLLANIYLEKFDKEFESRGVKVIRHADDILLLAKSMRAAERLLGTRYSISREEIKAQGKHRKEPSSKCIFNPKFRFLGFAMGRNRKGAYIRIHANL